MVTNVAAREAESAWSQRPLGDVITLQRGFDLPSQDRLAGHYPIVSSSGVSGSHHESRVHGPGVVTGRYGTIGQVFFIEGDFWPLNTTLYVKDFKGNDPRFVYYLLHTLDFQSANDKSSVPGVNRNHLHQIPVRVPPLTEQRAIAATLGALDDKIELNRRVNETLEAIARAIFKSWFVDFDPVRAKVEGREPWGMDAETAALFPDSFADSELGPIPAGWEVKPLDDVARFLNGLALQRFPPDVAQSLPVVKISELRQGITDSSGRASSSVPKQYVVDDGDLLFSWSGSLEVVIWTHGRGALNQHLFKVIPLQLPQWFVHLALLRHLPTFREIAAGKATTMGHIQRHHLHEAFVITPPARLVEAVEQVFAPLVHLIVQNAVQQRALRELRDQLLPQLLSGRVRAVVEEAREPEHPVEVRNQV